MAEKEEKPTAMRIRAGYDPSKENDGHRTSRVPPLHIATPGGALSSALDAGGTGNRDGDKLRNQSGTIETLADLWAMVGRKSNWRTPNDSRTTARLKPVTGLLAA